MKTNKQHVKEVAAKTYLKRLMILVKLGLDDTNRIKTLICTYSRTESFKELLAKVYDYYVKYRGLSCIEPRFKREDKLIFGPFERAPRMIAPMSTAEKAEKN